MYSTALSGVVPHEVDARTVVVEMSVKLTLSTLVVSVVCLSFDCGVALRYE